MRQSTGCCRRGLSTCSSSVLEPEDSPVNLLGASSHVRAVEPDDRMRAVLADRVPRAEVVAGQAEDIPADDTSFDAVMMASAWHWVDEERALPEVARVLRPGGWLSLLWSGPDRTIDWVRAIFAGGQTLSAERIEAWDARRRERHTVNLGPESPFTEPERRMVSWTMPMTRAEILGLVGTYSVAITMSATARQEHVASIARHLDTHTALATEEVWRCRCAACAGERHCADLGHARGPLISPGFGGPVGTGRWPRAPSPTG